MGKKYVCAPIDCDDKYYEKAVIPEVEILYVMQYPGCELPREQVRRSLIFNRYRNAICNHCYYPKCVDITEPLDKKLLICTGCYCTFYCSRACQTLDRPKHRDWCGKPDAKNRDFGPHMSVLADRDGTENIHIYDGKTI